VRAALGEEAVMKKDAILQLLRDMPEEIDADELMYRLYLRQKLEASEAAVEAGEILSHEEVVQRSEEWLK
jgi:hypothetical protein